jgi:hypothetical protein
MMQLLPLEIRVHGTSLAGEDVRMIRRCVERFASSSGHIVRCRVTVDAPRQRPGAHTKYTARVQLDLPSGEIVVAEPPSVDRFGVIQEALDAAGRKLEDYAVHHRYHPA